MRLNLSWKVSLIVSLTIIVAMVVVGLVMYQSVGDVVREQINEKIALMSSYQWETIQDVFSNAERELKRIAQDSNVLSLADLANSMSEEEMNEFLGRQILQSTGNRLNREVSNWNLLYSLSISTNRGVVIGDSRYREATVADMMAGIDADAGADFVRIRLDEKQYRDIPLGSTIEYDGTNFVIHSVPITRPNSADVIGYLIAAFHVEPLFASLSTELGEYGSAVLVNKAGVTLSHGDPTLIGVPMENQWYLDRILSGTEYAEEMREKEYLTITSLAGGDLFLVSNISVEHMSAPVKAIASSMITMFSITLVVIFVAVALFVWWQLKPLGVFVTAFTAMESGDLNSRRFFSKRMERRRDEIGSLVTAFISMEGNLKSIVDAVGRSSQETASSTQQLSASTQEASASIQEVAAKASNLAHSASSINRSMAEFAETVEQLNRNAQQMDKASTQVTALARDGLQLMETTESSMASLLDSSEDATGSVINLNRAAEEIESIVAVINDIAEQTNLLSLNASIEAARAGEHGRGFAVVADEVRKLADETRNSTHNIVDIIRRLATQTTETTTQINLGATNVKNTKETFTEIVALIADLATTVREVTNSIALLSSSTDSIVEETNKQALDGEEILAATEQQAAMTSENATLMTRLAAMAAELQDLVAKFDAH
ncbi:MAG: methyl-accepting chemotaxis protein [Firmicutes bacterium]|nr:methyl-accepting chemotaxis protein [Bacillota bacterium]